jgi:hypothetical protein
VRDQDVRVGTLAAFVRLAPDVAYDENDPLILSVRPPTGSAKVIELQPIEGVLGGLPGGLAQFPMPGIEVSAGSSWQIEVTAVPAALATSVEVGGMTVQRLDSTRVLELGLLCHYTI